MKISESLEALCSLLETAGDHSVPSFVERTRLERLLYGVVAEIASSRLRTRASGLSYGQLGPIEEGLRCSGYVEEAIAVARIRECYARLLAVSDTSNWAHDSRYSRIALCHKEVQLVCISLAALSAVPAACN